MKGASWNRNSKNQASLSELSGVIWGSKKNKKVFITHTTGKHTVGKHTKDAHPILAPQPAPSGLMDMGQ